MDPTTPQTRPGVDPVLQTRALKFGIAVGIIAILGNIENVFRLLTNRIFPNFDFANVILNILLACYCYYTSRLSTYFLRIWWAPYLTISLTAQCYVSALLDASHGDTRHSLLGIAWFVSAGLWLALSIRVVRHHHSMRVLFEDAVENLAKAVKQESQQNYKDYVSTAAHLRGLLSVDSDFLSILSTMTKDLGRIPQLDELKEEIQALKAALAQANDKPAPTTTPEPPAVLPVNKPVKRRRK